MSEAGRGRRSPPASAHEAFRRPQARGGCPFLPMWRQSRPARTSAPRSITVGFENRAREQRGRQKVEVSVSVNVGLRNERHRFTERLQHGREEEIPAELHKIGRPGRLGDMNRLLPQDLERGPAGLDIVWRASGRDEELARRGELVGRPKTGAVTYRWPAAACAAASRSDSATLIVLIEMWILPLAKLASIPLSLNTTLSTATSSASIVTTRSPRHASPTLAAGFAPRSISERALPGVRL